MSVRQNILLSNANKSVLYDLNNDIQLNFPSSLFFKAPNAIELVNFDLKCELTVLGNSNNVITIIYESGGEEFEIDVGIPYGQDIKTDFDLAQAIQNALNSHTYGDLELEFEVTETTIINVVSNPIIEVDSSTTNYAIKVNKPVTISFEHKDSIGMLIGFGGGVYRNVVEIFGTSTQSISTYNFIESFNESAANNTYPNYNDVNCKMCMYDSAGVYIPNASNPTDTTISINPTASLRQYDNIGNILMDIEDAMNSYANEYTPAAKFSVTYDYTTDKITISNETGARFGIGFDCYKETQNVTSGSLHAILGFEQKKYMNSTQFISPSKSKAFEKIFAEDYVLMCSNLSNNSNDLNIIGIGAANNVKSNDILFAIPFSKISSFEPKDSSIYRAKISNSPFAIGYKNRTFSDENPNFASFYLRTLSGRHIAATAQWSAMISFIF